MWGRAAGTLSIFTARTGAGRAGSPVKGETPVGVAGRVGGGVAGAVVGVGLGSDGPGPEQPYNPAAVSAHSSAVRTRPGRLTPRSPVM
ncbi:hypothetical protein GCM10010299_37820 [Streptomyces tanashiensis]|nr:hypothetical protein GCM10010299_37820 [Streptomyces tanashiensis]